MSFKEQNYLTSYNKAEHDIAEMFYLPCMRNAVSYDRISGYFGSTIYIIAWDALREFIEHDGKMRLICSPFLSDEDKDALSEGYSAKNDEILATSIEKEVESLFDSPSLTAPAKLLSYMVVEGIIDVQIAVLSGKESPDARRLFHDKVGIFTDSDGNKVGFRGSMNETFNGLSSDGNMESIDVFPDWMDERDAERANEASVFFRDLWSDLIPGITVYPFPEASKEILRAKSEGAQWEELLEEVRVIENVADRWKPNSRPDCHTPRTHQVNALNAWEQHNRRGIFEHATGSGKTFTAMCAIHDAFKHGDTVLILVPSKELLGQWDKEVNAILTDDNIKCRLCGDGNNEWKKNGNLARWTEKDETDNYIVIATMDTARTDEFIKNVSKGGHLFLVADEVHELGSQKRRNILNLNTGARLGLSATPRRYGDPEGTEALFEYFDGIIPPPYTLDNAIQDKVLTPYFYDPLTVQLTAEEQEQWNEISKEISKLVARLNTDGNSDINLESNSRLKILLINRAKIVKNAAGKVPLAIDLLKEEFKEGQRWIVYCDNIAQLKEVANGAYDAGLNVCEYYADMPGDREETLHYFRSNSCILVSVKCLDEGVDIPEVTHALILASSQNPREFIQRRGRILRKAPGKTFAHLYDAITLPIQEDENTPKSLSIIATELSRAIQFGEGAENPSCIANLKNIAIDYDIDYNELKDTGMEEDTDES